MKMARVVVVLENDINNKKDRIPDTIVVKNTIPCKIKYLKLSLLVSLLKLIFITKEYHYLVDFTIN